MRGLYAQHRGKSLVHDTILSADQRSALIQSVRKSYMEIFPTATIESKLDVLEPGAYVAVTCSPTKGIGETLEMSQRIARRGFRVVPHVAARMVRDKQHLREIMKRLDDTPIVSLFIPGGDAAKPAGNYTSALDLLRDVADIGHRFKEIGIAAHPEGHPFIGNDALMEQLLQKQQYANYIVTQMCFDAGAISAWLDEARQKGIDLPVCLGIPGASDRNTLIRTSVRIGVGDSLRYLKKQRKNAAHLLAAREYRPDRLLFDLAPVIAKTENKILSHHIFCFNQVERAEQWRHTFVRENSV